MLLPEMKKTSHNDRYMLLSYLSILKYLMLRRFETDLKKIEATDTFSLGRTGKLASEIEFNLYDDLKKEKKSRQKAALSTSQCCKHKETIQFRFVTILK